MKFELSKYRLFSLILILFISSVLAFGQDAPLSGLDDYVNKAIKDWDVPGVSIAIVKDDKVIFVKGYGVREIGKTDAVTPNTIFAIVTASAFVLRNVSTQ